MNLWSALRRRLVRTMNCFDGFASSFKREKNLSRTFRLVILVLLWSALAALNPAQASPTFFAARLAAEAQGLDASRQLVANSTAPQAGDRQTAKREEPVTAPEAENGAEPAGQNEHEQPDILASLFPELKDVLGGESGEPASTANNHTFAPGSSVILAQKPAEEHVQWKPLLLQSLNFMLVEQGFRYVQQAHIRHLLWHKPFWQDYFVSLAHWDLSHWGDGDNFITNYVGHPVQGAVSGYIWIQNDPRARNAQFGSGAYWRSRMKAFAWATAYSLEFEEGPILSETAIGSQGGYYFVPDCPAAPCSKPGKKYKPATTGTGWVDLVITPTVGLAWILLEDTISAKLLPRLGGDDPSLVWRVVGSALTPSKTMALIMGGHLPWGRYYETAKFRADRAAPALAEAAGGDTPRFEAGIHYVNVSLPMDWRGCTGCRVSNSGVGGIFTYRLTRGLWFDSETDYFPGGGGTEKGPAIEGLYGIRYGVSHPRWAVYAKVRPGFIYYEQASSYPNADELRALTRFAFDTGTVLEYHASRHGTLRLDAGVTFVRYLQGLDPQQPSKGWISPDYYATQGNFQLAFGYARRF